MSVDPPEVSEQLRQKLAFDIRFLVDEQGTLMDALGIRDAGGMPSAFIAGRKAGRRDIFLPTSFLLDGEGVIRWAFRPETYRVRAPVDEVLRAIDAPS